MSKEKKINTMIWKRDKSVIIDMNEWYEMNWKLNCFCVLTMFGMNIRWNK